MGMHWNFAGTAVNDTSSVTAAASAHVGQYVAPWNSHGKAVTVKLTGNISDNSNYIGTCSIYSEKEK